MDSRLAQNVDHASEAVRAANHFAHGPVSGPDASTVVGSLVELVHRLPQLLDHLARGLQGADLAEHFHDQGTDPATALCHAHGALVDARGLVDDVAGLLEHAHNYLGHLGQLTSED